MIPLIMLGANDAAALVDFYAGLHANFVAWGDRRPGVPWKRVPAEIEILEPSHALPARLRGRLSMLVDDMDAALAHVTLNGGAVLLPASAVGPRRMALVRDPQGNQIGFHTRAS